MKEVEYTLIPIDELGINTGQIPGVHKNPRRISEDRFKKLMESLKNLPSMTKAKPLNVYPYKGKYVVLGGNQRLEAMRKLKYSQVWCAVYPEETTVEELERIMLTDNASFGEWLNYELVDFDTKFDFEIIGLNLEDNEIEEDDFEQEFKKYNDSNCVYPIVPKFDEKHEVFIILSSSEVDSNHLRQMLNMNKMRSYKSSSVAKSNIVDIKDVLSVLSDSKVQ